MLIIRYRGLYAHITVIYCTIDRYHGYIQVKNVYIILNRIEETLTIILVYNICM